VIKIFYFVELNTLRAVFAVRSLKN